MYIPNFPEDSVLSRHFEAAAEIRRQMWQQIPPSDSVLRRHAMSPESHTTARSAPAPVAASGARRAATAPVRDATEEKGFIAWLFGLFTRKA
jgi:hypothetical protein